MFGGMFSLIKGTSLPTLALAVLMICAGCATGRTRAEVARVQRAEQARADAERLREERVRRENSALESAHQQGTYDAYEAFLQEFPKGTRAREANVRLLDLQLEKAVDSFQVTKAIATQEAHTFCIGYVQKGDRGFEPSYKVRTPAIGDVFVVVEWSLGEFQFRGEDFRFDASELMVLSEGEDDVGYMELPRAGGREVWQHAKGFSSTWAPGKPRNGKRLFIVRQENMGSLQLRFFDRAYPLHVEPELTP